MNLTINRASSSPAEAVNLATTAAPASKVEKNGWPDANLRISSVEGEAEIEISEDDLRRDDALGKLFDRAFSLPCPAMPAFQE